MTGLSNLALVALTAQYLLFRGYLTFAFRRARMSGKLPSAHLTSRWELRGKSFEILGLAFIGFIVSSGFWGHGVDGEHLIGGLLWAIFAGRTIALVWPRGAIRRLGYLLSLVPIIVMVGLGGAGAVLQLGWLREEVRSEAAPHQNKPGSSEMQMASAGDKPKDGVAEAAEGARPRVVPQSDPDQPTPVANAQDVPNPGPGMSASKAPASAPLQAPDRSPQREPGVYATIGDPYERLNFARGSADDFTARGIPVKVCEIAGQEPSAPLFVKCAGPYRSEEEASGFLSLYKGRIHGSIRHLP